MMNGFDPGKWEGKFAPVEERKLTMAMRSYYWLKDLLRFAVTDMMCWLRLPGFVRRLDIYDDITETRLVIDVNRFHTAVKIGRREYFFSRVTGRLIWVGMWNPQYFDEKKMELTDPRDGK